MRADLPHPTAPGAPAEPLVELVRGGPEPPWHHRIALGARWRVPADPGVAPGPAGSAPVSLGVFHREDPAAEIEVYGVTLDREIDPADWLDDAPLLEGAEVVSRRVEPADEGARGDLVATRGDGRAARIFAAKWGARLFAVRAEARADDYPALADELLLALRSLEPVERGGRFAEPVRAESSAVPVPWKLSLPASWTTEPGGEREGVSSFQATNLAHRGEPGAEAVGKLAFAVLARDAWKRPREVANLYLEALAEAGLRVHEDDFEEEPAAEPFDRSWILVSRVARTASLPGELRLRVLRHERVWVLAGVLCPREEDDRAAWMQDKRALDVVTTTLRIKG